MGSRSRGNEWSTYLPNGGFGAKQPPGLIGLGPSPLAVNFLQEELGQSPAVKSTNYGFLNSLPSPTIPYVDGKAESGLEMKQLMNLSRSQDH